MIWAGAGAFDMLMSKACDPTLKSLSFSLLYVYTYVCVAGCIRKAPAARMFHKYFLEPRKDVVTPLEKRILRSYLAAVGYTYTSYEKPYDLTQCFEKVYVHTGIQGSWRFKLAFNATTNPDQGAFGQGTSTQQLTWAYSNYVAWCRERRIVSLDKSS